MRTVSFHLHKTALSSDGSWCCPHAQAHVYSRVFRALRGAGEHSAQERTTEQGQEQQQQLSSKTVRPYALPVPDKHDKTPPSRAYMRRVIDMQVCILRNSISTLFGNVCAACRMRIVLRLLTLLQLMAAARFVASNKRITSEQFCYGEACRVLMGHVTLKKSSRRRRRGRRCCRVALLILRMLHELSL